MFKVLGFRVLTSATLEKQMEMTFLGGDWGFQKVESLFGGGSLYNTDSYTLESTSGPFLMEPLDRVKGP